MSKEPFTLADVQWGITPKIEDERFIPIYSPRPGKGLYLWSLNDCAVTVPTHYVWRRTVPCVGAANACEGCAIKRQLRVKAYLGCYEPEFSRVVMLELTQEALAYSNVELIKPKESLRAKYVHCWRLGAAVNGAVRVELADTRQAPSLPEAFDVRPALLRIWNGANRPK